MSDHLKAVGVCSRPSLEGVDIALIDTDGDLSVVSGPSLHVPYSREMKIFLRRAITAAREGRDGAADIGKAAGEVTSAFVTAIERFLDQEKIKRTDIDIVGVGGHSILYRAPEGAASPGRQWRIGDGKTIAEETRIDVVSDFETADLAAGGYGAPLAPVFFRALIASITDRPNCPVGVIDLGAAAHLVYVPEQASPADLLAYDSGPCLGLLDEWAQARPARKNAQVGAVNDEILRMMGLHPYLRLAPPKFLDRYKFSLDQVLKLSAEDGAATLAAFTADCISRAEKFLPEPPGGYICHGEGLGRPALMQMLGDRLEAEVATTEDAGWRNDTLDAQCFAFLAVRSLKKTPLTYPKTTRAPAPTLGGAYFRAPV